MSNIRDRICALALSYDGVNCTTGRGRYLDLVGPLEAAAMRDYLAAPKTSGCALVVRGIWRSLGLRSSRLAPPYKPGMAVADLFTIARACGAYVSAPFGDARPKPGDCVLVGDMAANEVEHVYTVLSCAGNELESCDGGQRDASGNQAIAVKVRTWTVSGSTVWDRARRPSDPGSGGPRKVRGWVDVEKLDWPDLGASPLTIAAPVPSQPGGALLPARPTLRLGARGEAVAELQRRIVALPADGVFGPKTDAAVKAWQRSAGLEPDGVVGTRTWALLLA